VGVENDTRDFCFYCLNNFGFIFRSKKGMKSKESFFIIGFCIGAIFSFLAFVIIIG